MSDETKALKMRVEMPQGEPRRVVLTHPWPAICVISKSILENRSEAEGVSITDTAEGISITLSNGQASYRKTSEDETTVTFELEPGSSYTEVPEPKLATDDAAARAAAADRDFKAGADVGAGTLNYDGPAVGESVTHRGSRKIVHGTHHDHQHGSTVSFQGDEENRYPVSEVKPIEDQQ